MVLTALAAGCLGGPASVAAASDCSPSIRSPGTDACPTQGAADTPSIDRSVDLRRFGLRPRADAAAAADPADAADAADAASFPAVGDRLTGSRPHPPRARVTAVTQLTQADPQGPPVAGDAGNLEPDGSVDGHDGNGHPGESADGDGHGEPDERAADADQTATPPARSAAAALERLLLDGRDSDDNDFVIGVAASAGPSYSGASDTTYSVRPAARLTWRGYSISTQSVARASARVESTSGGERTGFSGPLRVRNRFSFGFGATINRGRDVSAEGAGLGLKSLPSTVMGRLRLRYALDERTSLSATLIGDVLNRQRNIELPMSIGRHYVLSDRMLLGLNAGMNVVNRRGMDNDYGIGPEQSAASGRPMYQPKGGLREFAVSATLIHEPDNHWIWMTQFSLVRLVGDAARSPLVRQKLQPNLMFGLAYRISWD